MEKFPKLIFSDFDGTLTEQGKFSPVFFDVLKLIKANKSELVIVTGRPLSWAHFLLTHFELSCVITEGGGMLSMKKEGSDFFEDTALIEENNIKHLQKITRELLIKFPKVFLSEDSACRVTDRAIDLDVLKVAGLDSEIEEFLVKNDINFSRSNVHLNFWSGCVSKRKSIEHYLKLKKVDRIDCLYFGDSLNDESAFEYINHSVGVANIASVENKMTTLPKVILRGSEKEEINGVYYYLKNCL